MPVVISLLPSSQQGAFSEKDEQLRQLILKLDSIETPKSLTLDDMSAIRRELVDGQHVLKETTDKLRQLQKDHEAIARKKDEIEARHATLEVEYEELLGKW